MATMVTVSANPRLPKSAGARSLANMICEPKPMTRVPAFCAISQPVPISVERPRLLFADVMFAMRRSGDPARLVDRKENPLGADDFVRRRSRPNNVFRRQIVGRQIQFDTTPASRAPVEPDIVPCALVRIDGTGAMGGMALRHI